MTSEQIDIIKSALYSELSDHIKMNENGNYDDEDLKYMKEQISLICAELGIEDIPYLILESEQELAADQALFRQECKDHNL